MTDETGYDVFISHAWEDKTEFVKPLVERLIELGLNVWYDELSLDLGDSLRENIDRGLRSSEYGVVVLSHAFFSKRWPQRELNGLVQKAMGEDRKVILPVWHGVTREEVADYSLPLSDLVAARSEEGIDNVANSIFRVVQGGDRQREEEEIDFSHRTSEQKLLASAKHIIADPTKVVGVHELADALARDAFTSLKAHYESALPQAPNNIDIAELFDNYRITMSSVLSFCALASNLGDFAHFPSVSRVAAIVTRDPGPDTGSKLNEGLWQYPAALLIYVIGLSALQKSRLPLVKDVLLDVHQESQHADDRICLVGYVNWYSIAKHAGDIYRPDEKRTYKTPLSEHLLMEAPALIGSYFVDDQELEHVFDLFEYILGLAFASHRLRIGRSLLIPPGRYMWKHHGDEGYIPKLHAEAEALGIRGALFDSNSDWVKKAFEYAKEASQQRSWWL